MLESQSQPPKEQGQWWVRTPAGQFGPADLATLRQWAQQRRVGPGDFVCNTETGAWVPAGNEPLLAGCFPPQAPPYPGAFVPAGKRSSGCLVAGIVVGVIGFFCIAILAGMLLPALARAREQARRGSCLMNLRQLGLATKQYSQDYREVYPWREDAPESHEAWRDLGLLYPNYCSAPKTFFCPSSKDRIFAFEPVGVDAQGNPIYVFPGGDSKRVISYSYGLDNSGDGDRPWTENAASTVRLLADKKAGTEMGSPGNPVNLANHKDDGRNVLYNDGHVKWKAGERALDPDEDDNKIGAPFAPDYQPWWSDPPYYGE